MDSMSFLLLICAILISTTTQLAKSGEVVYNADCKPPDGFTGGTYSTNSLLPIEKCCPQTDPCNDIQGYCTLKWAIELYPRMCDHMTYDCRDYQCVCCVKCSEDKCSKCTETRGECKKECRPDEVEDTANPCSHGKCKCCKKCDIQPECQDAGGTCVGSYEQCPLGSLPSNHGCCGGCFCCKPTCQPLPACSQVEGAYCSLTDSCSDGFYACHGLCQKSVWKGGYAQVEKCYCCIPKWTGDYLSFCPAENTSTPEYKNPDKGEIDFHNWSSSSAPESGDQQEQPQQPEDPTLVDDDPSNNTHGVVVIVQPIKPIKIDTTHQPPLASTQLVVAVNTAPVGGDDATDGGDFGTSPVGEGGDTTDGENVDTTPVGERDATTIGARKTTKRPLVPIRPFRDQVVMANKVQDAHAKEVDSVKVTRLSDEEKTNKAALLSKKLSPEATKDNKNINKADNTIHQHGEHLPLNNHKRKDQAMEIDTHGKAKSTTTVDQKEIFKAINLLKKLLFKNKAHRRRNKLNSLIKSTQIKSNKHT